LRTLIFFLNRQTLSDLLTDVFWSKATTHNNIIQPLCNQAITSAIAGICWYGVSADAWRCYCCLSIIWRSFPNWTKISAANIPRAGRCTMITRLCAALAMLRAGPRGEIGMAWSTHLWLLWFEEDYSLANAWNNSKTNTFRSGHAFLFLFFLMLTMLTVYHSLPPSPWHSTAHAPASTPGEFGMFAGSRCEVSVPFPAKYPLWEAQTGKQCQVEAGVQIYRNGQH
jgi:hypothetical protein